MPTRISLALLFSIAIAGCADESTDTPAESTSGDTTTVETTTEETHDHDAPDHGTEEPESTEETTTAHTEGDTMTGPLSFEMETLAGEKVALSKYSGDVVLVVNVASACGLTPQYEKLQALHKQYSEKGLSVVAFPCNQFGGQEPGSADEIQEFCSSKYGVEFDMMAKVEVNGDGACDLYKHLTSLDTTPQGSGKIGWNFEKFLIDRSGKVINRFSPRTEPDDAELVTAVETALAATP